ncbi:MAG: polysaccharide deacetylase family protein [Candidatus Odinarchaeia archaeon]
MKNYFDIEMGINYSNLFIKKIIKEVLAFLFRFSGIPLLIREVFCKNKVTIIYYHNPKPEVFKKHIEYLARNFIFILLDRLINAINNKNWSDIPPRSLIITIDDGFKENYALTNIFKTYNVCPTIYLCSHIVNTNRMFWFKAGFCNFRKLKKYDNNQRLNILKDKLGYELQKEYLVRQALNFEELLEMSMYVDFQSHSRYHPILTSCTNKECKKEIAESKNYLGKLLNKEIKHFSYPNGNYTDREIRYVKDCGYKSARTIDVGWNDVNSDPYRLKSMGIEDNASINILCAQISGFFGYLRYLLCGNFKCMSVSHHF